MIYTQDIDHFNSTYGFRYSFMYILIIAFLASFRFKNSTQIRSQKRDWEGLLKNASIQEYLDTYIDICIL